MTLYYYLLFSSYFSQTHNNLFPSLTRSKLNLPFLKETLLLIKHKMSSVNVFGKMTAGEKERLTVICNTDGKTDPSQLVGKEHNDMFV